MGAITDRFAELRAKNEKALVLFVTAGDPSLEELPVILEALTEGGADIIEVGIPFSDPIADGPTIQASSQRALDRGVTPEAARQTVAGSGRATAQKTRSQSSTPNRSKSSRRSTLQVSPIASSSLLTENTRSSPTQQPVLSSYVMSRNRAYTNPSRSVAKASKSRPKNRQQRASSRTPTTSTRSSQSATTIQWSC